MNTTVKNIKDRIILKLQEIDDFVGVYWYLNAESWFPSAFLKYKSRNVNYRDTIRNNVDLKLELNVVYNRDNEELSEFVMVDLIDKIEAKLYEDSTFWWLVNWISWLSYRETIEDELNKVKLMTIEVDLTYFNYR